MKYGIYKCDEKFVCGLGLLCSSRRSMYARYLNFSIIGSNSYGPSLCRFSYDATQDPGQKHFLERLESRHGIHTIESAADLGFGTRDYELIQID